MPKPTSEAAGIRKQQRNVIQASKTTLACAPATTRREADPQPTWFRRPIGAHSIALSAILNGFFVGTDPWRIHRSRDRTPTAVASAASKRFTLFLNLRLLRLLVGSFLSPVLLRQQLQQHLINREFMNLRRGPGITCTQWSEHRKKSCGSLALAGLRFGRPEHPVKLHDGACQLPGIHGVAQTGNFTGEHDPEEATTNAASVAVEDAQQTETVCLRGGNGWSCQR